MDQHEIFRLTQKLVLFNEETKSFLLVKDAEMKSLYYKEYGPWEFVGGRVHEDEDLREAFEREVKEEVGEIKYELVGAVHLVRTQNEVGPVACLAYLGIHKGGEITLSDEHTELRWETAENIEKSKEYKPWLKETIRSAEKRLTERSYLDDLRRNQADFENYKKRQSQEKDELSRYMVNAIVTELIPVLDNFHMAVEHVPTNKKDDPWVTGITYIEKQFEEVLDRYGVKVMEIKVGEIFDPERHEAIEDVSSSKNKVASEEVKDDELLKSKSLVIEKVLQKGYMMGDKVIRAAKVSVTS